MPNCATTSNARSPTLSGLDASKQISDERSGFGLVDSIG
jgi:hypothetical protein